MAKIMFEKLTVEEEKNVLGGTYVPEGGGCIAPKPLAGCIPD